MPAFTRGARFPLDSWGPFCPPSLLFPTAFLFPENLEDWQYSLTNIFNQGTTRGFECLLLFFSRIGAALTSYYLKNIEVFCFVLFFSVLFFAYYQLNENLASFLLQGCVYSGRRDIQSNLPHPLSVSW